MYRLGRLNNFYKPSIKIGTPRKVPIFILNNHLFTLEIILRVNCLQAVPAVAMVG